MLSTEAATGQEFRRTLGDYTLRRQIGRGGMGVVYEAWQDSMDRRVALKVLPPGVAADDEGVPAVPAGGADRRAAQPPERRRGLRRLGSKERTPYYAMEFVEGETLAQIVARMRAAAPDAQTAFGASREEQALLPRASPRPSPTSPTASSTRTRRASSTGTSSPRT